MAHSPDKKIKLRAAYIGGLPLEAAADKIGVPLPTARTWYREARAAGDDWDKFQRASLIVSGGEVEQAMGRVVAVGMVRCEALLDRVDEIDDPVAAAEVVAALGDTISKLRAAAKMFMPETAAQSIMIDTLKALAAWGGESAADKGLVLAAVLEGFAQQKKMQIAAPLEELRARARAAGASDGVAKASGLSDDSAEEIRKRILGVDKK